LAARAIAGRLDDEQRMILREDDRLYRPEWREVVLLLAGLLHKQGRAKTDALVHAVLSFLSHTASLAEKARAVGLI